MVRLAFALLIAAALPAHAGELPRTVGLYPTGGQTSLAMVESKIDVTVRGPIVEAVVTQRFQNRTDHATEATYVFPLPLDAAVSAMSIHAGTRTIEAKIEKREDAQRRYEDAVAAGVGASLLDQERADVFTQSIAAIPAKGSVEITMRYDSVARYAQGSWELVVPMVVAPRYVPGTATGRPTTGTGRSPDTDRAPDASRVTPPGGPGMGGSTKLVVHFADPVRDIASPSHEVKLSGKDATLVDLKSDHDAIVRWRAGSGAAGWVESASDGGYAAVVLEAPGPAAKRGAVKLTLVLDRSAASLGDADVIAHPLVRALFATMTTTDRVAVAGSDHVAWSTPADAGRSVDQTWSSPAGAFDLTKVLASVRPDGAPLVLVTGGLVADDRAAIAAATKLGVPVHVIGVGPAPARATLVSIAAATGGTVRFAVPGDDVSALAKAALADLATPPPSLTVTWGTLDASEIVPGTLARLGAGQATLVLARVKQAHRANARARGELFAIEPLAAPRAVDGTTTTMGPLARRWARNRLDELLAQRAPAATVIAHALRYGLVSPYTSMVAVGTEVIVQGGAKRSVAVAVSVPAGMKWQQVKKQTTVETTVDPNRDGDGAKQKKPEKKAIDRRPEPPPVTVQDSAPTIDRGDSDDEEDTLREPRSKDFAAATGSAGGEAYEESIEISSSESVTWRRRLSLFGGGGVSRSSGANDGVVFLGGRLELGARTLLGLEASFQLVGGDAEGGVLVTVARRGLGRWFELGGGVGVHLGNGVGPAASLGLKLHVPPLPRAAPYLRYDGALLLDEGTRRGQSSITLGLELGF